jgi:uncharacterized membrane protein YdbT with pleckstrin-like domain
VPAPLKAASALAGSLPIVQLLEGEKLIWEGHPTWRSTLSFYLSWGFFALIPLIVIALVVGLTDTDWPIWVGIVITVVLLALLVLVGWVRRIFTVYTITSQRISIRRGILSKTESTARIDRVQNVTITQSPIDRILKVGAVDFDTASDDPTDQFRFGGVDDPQALRERIYRANQQPAAGQSGLA